MNCGLIVNLKGMETTYNLLGKPGVFRNDRFWLSGDHIVDPRINELPQVQALISVSERAKKTFKMTEYQGIDVSSLFVGGFPIAESRL